jgi:hypothetical protein
VGAISHEFEIFRKGGYHSFLIIIGPYGETLPMTARPRDIREVSVASLGIHRRNAWHDCLYRSVFYSGVGALVAVATLEAFLPRTSDDPLVFVVLYVLGWIAAFNSLGFLAVRSASVARALSIKIVHRRIIRPARGREHSPGIADAVQHPDQLTLKDIDIQCPN